MKLNAEFVYPADFTDYTDFIFKMFKVVMAKRFVFTMRLSCWKHLDGAIFNIERKELDCIHCITFN
jgi:hypothetical protein